MSSFTKALVGGSNFNSSLVLEKGKKRKWKVYRDFTYHVGREGSGETITVPVGFETDLASIPRFFWRVLPPDGDYSQAAVLHDYLCSVSGRVNGRQYSVREVSDIFREAMGVLGVSAFARNVMHFAVYRFGPKWKVTHQS